MKLVEKFLINIHYVIFIASVSSLMGTVLLFIILISSAFLFGADNDLVKGIDSLIENIK